MIDRRGATVRLAWMGLVLASGVFAGELAPVDITRKVVGEIQANAYFLRVRSSRAVVVVDPGDQADEIVADATTNGGKLAAALITHGHGDHLGGAAAVAMAARCRVYVHPDDGDSATAAGLKTFERLSDGETLDLAGIRLKVLHVPGHSPGSVAFLLENPCTVEGVTARGAVLISGDTLFARGVGRTFRPADERTMLEGIRNKLLALPQSTRVLPGHMEGSTLADVRPWLEPMIDATLGRPGRRPVPSAYREEDGVRLPTRATQTR